MSVGPISGSGGGLLFPCASNECAKASFCKRKPVEDMAMMCVCVWCVCVCVRVVSSTFLKGQTGRSQTANSYGVPLKDMTCLNAWIKHTNTSTAWFGRPSSQNQVFGSHGAGLSYLSVQPSVHILKGNSKETRILGDHHFEKHPCR